MSQSGATVSCAACGAMNRASAKFCGGCGNALAREVACKSCGTKLDPSLRFCDECGAPVESTHSQHATQSRSQHAAAPPPPPRSGVFQAFAGGRYELIRFLGEGGRKRVYLSLDTQLGREVAVSAFKSDGVEASALTRARREAEAMARLGDHPNIVTIYDIAEEGGELFLVSQYMSGGDLSGLLAQSADGRLSIRETVRIGMEVARALEHAHAHEVIHRDIKPQNIWLSPDGTAKLGDFGLAMAADRSRLTVEGAMVGTVAYMSPEQGLGRNADARSDLYSLGVVIYELCCGVPPFVGDGAAAVISQHVSTAPVVPSWHRADLPRALERVILKLLAKTAEERFQSAAEVREALEAIDAASGVAQAPAQDGTADALDRLTDGVFIGRQSETKELRAAVDEAVAGRGRVVMVTGEAGMGKTRLAVEVETYAQLRGATVVWSRCHSDAGAPAYWPWVQVVRAYARSREPDELLRELGSGASDIAQVVTDLRSRIPDLPEPQPLDPEQARFRLFDSVTTFLRNASTARPLAIFLEDVHLADKPSLLLLEFLARELQNVRIFLLATYRDDEVAASHPLADVLESLSRERTFHSVSLGGLTDREVRVLLQEVSRQTLESPAELTLVDEVYEVSGGNPYFVEQIIRHLVESGGIYLRDGKWQSDARNIHELGIPRGMREVIDRRLSSLPEKCRELMSVASAIGNEFDLPVVERASGLPAATVVDLVKEALSAGIVAAVPGELNRYQFEHVATRDALYQELPGPQRMELHRSIGEALEDLYEDRIDSHLAQLAHHFAEAASDGLAEKAADYSWWAGERAAALAAYEDAVRHYMRALELFDTVTEEPTRRAELLLVLGDATWRTGDVARAKEIFLEVSEIAERLSLRDQYARAALGYGGTAGGIAAADRPDERLVQLLRAAMYGLPERDSLLRVRVLARLAVELSLADDRNEPDALSREAVEMAERLGDARTMLLALYSRQWATMGPDGAEDSVAAGEEIIRRARVVGDREMEFHGHHLVMNAFIHLGDIRSADREIRACENLAKKLRQPTFEWQVAVFRVMRALMQGRFEEGERLASAAFKIGQRSQPEVAAVVLGVHMFLISWSNGTMGDLEDGGEAFAAQYPNSAWPAALTWLLSEAEKRPKAQAAFLPLARSGFRAIRRDANWLTAMSCISLSCSYLEDAASAAVLYEMFSPYADLCTSILAGAACVGSNHMFLAYLAKTAGRLDEAVARFEHALEINERIGAYFIVPRTYYGFAQTLLARGGVDDAERAYELIDKGLDKARELSLPKEVERLLSLKLESAGLSAMDVKTSIYAVANSVERSRPDLAGVAAPDGTVTIMFSDIEDSTVLTERLGDHQWLALLERHNEIVRRPLAEHGGYEVKSQGDGFMLAFASARKAIHCAIDVQRALEEHRRAHPDEPLRVRIGLHTGEALRSKEDFFGKNVILAARIAAQARGNQILVSSLLRELVSSTAEFEFEGERELELKGLSGSYRVFEVPWSPATDASGA